MSKSIVSGLVLLGIFSCAPSSTRTGNPEPRPQSLPSSTTSAFPLAGSWSFAYTPGSLRYQISRNATITNDSDSTSHHEVSSNLTHEEIVLDRSDTAFHIKAVIDTFSTTTQGLIGAVQPVLVPAELTGTLSSTGLTLNDSAFATSCSTAESLLKIDLNNLLIYFPTQLVPGSSWRDSVSSTGCQGGLTSNSYSVRTYTVQGQMDFQGIPVVIVQRVDTLSAHGEGAQQQHQVTFDATGTGSARYLVDTSRGRVVYLTTEQRLVFAVKASARTSSFTQLSKQDYRLTP